MAGDAAQYDLQLQTCNCMAFVGLGTVAGPQRRGHQVAPPPCRASLQGAQAFVDYAQLVDGTGQVP